MSEPNDIFSHRETIEGDRFNENLHPEIVAEITRLQRSLARIQSPNKGKIIIALLTGETIKDIWLDGNRELMMLLTSGFLPMPHLQALMSARKENSKFARDLEAFITARLVR